MDAEEERRLRVALLRDQRVILLLDADAFYAQVEAKRLSIDLSTTPLAVRQWDGLIAVSYAARAAGVTRHMRAPEAQRLCPALQLPHVEVLDAQGVPDPDPTSAKKATHKASLHRYRLASAGIFKLLVRICGERYVEKGSIDEAYIDVSPMVDLLIAGGAPWAVREVGGGAGGGGGGGGGAPGSPARARTRSRGEEEEAPPPPPLGAEEGTSLLAALDGVGVGSTCWAVPLACGAPGADVCCGTSPGWHGLDPACAFDLRLAAGALCAAHIRRRVLAETGYTLSAGVAIGSKTLAKLVAGRHKPDSMTILPRCSVPGLLSATPLTKIKGLGAKLGASLVEEVERLVGGGGSGGGGGEGEGEVGAGEARGGSAAGWRVKKENGEDEEEEEEEEEREEEVAEGEEDEGAGASAPGAAPPPPTPTLAAAQAIPLSRLRAAFGDEAGIALFRAVRGHDGAPVKPRTQPKSLLCAKSMAAASCSTLAAASGWLAMNCAELALRLEADAADWSRHPRKLVLHYRTDSGATGSKTGDMPPPRLTREALARAAVALLDKALLPCTHLAVGAADFLSTAGMQSVGSMFARQRASAATAAAAAAAGGGGAPLHAPPPPPPSPPPHPAAKKSAAMDAFLQRAAAGGGGGGERPAGGGAASKGGGRPAAPQGKKAAAAGGPLAALFTKQAQQPMATSEVVELLED
jgi:nucleotidyltransferase/DNA polymerase involved in DNA repair